MLIFLSFFGFFILLLCLYQFKEIKYLKTQINNIKDYGKEDKEEKIHLLFLLFGLILIAWVLSWFLIQYFIDKSPERGAFGDQFGSVNALFSGFALAGILYTIMLQKKELALQRIELEDTRKEFQTQNMTLKKQRFENTFFNLLSLHNEIVDKLSINIFDGSYLQRKFFEGAIKQLRFKSNELEYYIYSFFLKLDISEVNIFFTDKTQNYEFLKKLDEDEIKHMKSLSKEDLDAYLKISIEEKYEKIVKDYMAFYLDYQDNVGHYFRNLYHIFKYIYMTDLIVEDEKHFYTNIMRAQLSSDELILLFYNSIIPSLGYEKFKFLIDHYDILQNMSKNLLLDKDHFEIFNTKKVENNPFI